MHEPISFSSMLGIASFTRALLKSKYHLIKVTFTIFGGHERVQHPRIAHSAPSKHYGTIQFFDLRGSF